MAKYIIKRVLWVIPVMLGVLFIVFTISYFTPGDPILAEMGTNFDPVIYAQRVHEAGLDRPFLVQYVDYIVGIVTKFDLGTSYTYGHAVSGEIIARFGTTLKLGLMGVLVTTIIGVPFGIISATHQYSVLDSGMTIFSLFFAAMPNFWLALVLIILFAQTLHWLPATGIQSWKGWILPVIANAMPVLANVVRMARSSMLEVIRMDYIRTARSKGLKERTVIWKHALRNALIPIVTVIGMQISLIMAGSVIVESIFNIPALGSYMLAGISNRDYPVINGCILVLSATICVMNLVVDICYGFIDPRIMAQYKDSGKTKKSKTKKLAGAAAEGSVG